MPEKACRMELEGAIARLLLPGSNQLSCRAFLEQVRRQFSSLAEKEAVRGILVCGEDGHFCRTASEERLTPYEATQLSAFGQEALFAIEAGGKPVIAALSGDVTGLGLELSLACSFIVSDRDARFGFPGIASGHLPAFGGTQRLPRLVGRSMAKQMLFSGELISADEALRVRLVNRVYDAAELVGAASQQLLRICSRSPLAIRVGSEVINAGYDIDLKTACLLERDAFALCFASLDQKEGMGAFLEKREPQFAGV